MEPQELNFLRGMIAHGKVEITKGSKIGWSWPRIFDGREWLDLRHEAGLEVLRQVSAEHGIPDGAQSPDPLLVPSS